MEWIYIELPYAAVSVWHGGFMQTAFSTCCPLPLCRHSMIFKPFLNIFYNNCIYADYYLIRYYNLVQVCFWSCRRRRPHRRTAARRPGWLCMSWCRRPWCRYPRFPAFCSKKPKYASRHGLLARNMAATMLIPSTIPPDFSWLMKRCTGMTSPLLNFFWYSFFMIYAFGAATNIFIKNSITFSYFMLLNIITVIIAKQKNVN